jgi:hypothetical protein
MQCNVLTVSNTGEPQLTNIQVLSNSYLQMSAQFNLNESNVISYRKNQFNWQTFSPWTHLQVSITFIHWGPPVPNTELACCVVIHELQNSQPRKLSCFQQGSSFCLVEDPGTVRTASLIGSRAESSANSLARCNSIPSSYSGLYTVSPQEKFVSLSTEKQHLMVWQYNIRMEMFTQMEYICVSKEICYFEHSLAFIYGRQNSTVPKITVLLTYRSQDYFSLISLSIHHT